LINLGTTIGATVAPHVLAWQYLTVLLASSVSQHCPATLSHLAQVPEHAQHFWSSRKKPDLHAVLTKAEVHFLVLAPQPVQALPFKKKPSLQTEQPVDVHVLQLAAHPVQLLLCT
jgi:hypothetical protein